MKKLILLFVLITSASFAQAIYGRATYLENKKPAAGISIQLRDSSGTIIKKSTTNNDGVYCIDVSNIRGIAFLVATVKDFQYIKKTFKLPLWTPREFSFALRPNKNGSHTVNVLKDPDSEK